MEIGAVGYSDVGLDRESNQDCYLVDPELGLFMVCDGMGGHSAGELAAQNALEVIKEQISIYKPGIPLDNEEKTQAMLVTMLQNAATTACQKLLKIVDENPACAGMGTTMTLLMIHGEKGIMGHVGDSKLFLFRRSKFHQLSRDHTLACRLLSEGAISTEEFSSSPFSHVLTRCIGRDESVQVDTLVFDLIPGDVLLLCSDGFSNAFNNSKEMESLINPDKLPGLAPNKLQKLIDSAVKEAVKRDGSDNTTAILVSVTESAQVDDLARSQDVYLKIDTLKNVFLFNDLALQDILTVMEQVKLYDCTSGTIVVTEGTPGDSMYIILTGNFTVTREAKELAKLSAGSHFGEISLISPELRTASVKALSNARLLVINRENFNRLVRQHKEIGISILLKLSQELSSRLARADEALVVS